MMARRMEATIKKSIGIFITLGGTILIVYTLPLYLWPLLIGILFIWIGWQLFICDRY